METPSHTGGASNLMIDKRRSKRMALVEEFIEKIKRGNFPPGSEFPSTDELTRCFKISSGTAGRLTRELAAMGLLDVGRGRRSRVREGALYEQTPRLDKPVGVISPALDFPRHSRWRGCILHNLQRTLLEHGNDSVWLSEDFTPAKVAGDFSGFLFAGELVPAELWAEVKRSGKPCVKLSLERAEPDTVFLDYRPSIDHLTLQIIGRGCRRIIYLCAGEAEAEQARKWSARHGWDDIYQLYGINRDAISYPVVSADCPSGLEELRQLILASPEKIAFAAGSPHCMQQLIGLMAELGRESGVDFEFFSMSRIPHEAVLGHYIDVKCELIVSRMLDLFYRHCRTGLPQLGEIVYPELVMR